MKDLEFYCTEELNKKECKGIDGGWQQYVLMAIAYFAYESAANPKASHDSFMRGWDAAQ
tara:strand:- start:939 stop:1115 length:177 start_codon:yes stop_codon:yes gene_type:complete